MCQDCVNAARIPINGDTAIFVGDEKLDNLTTEYISPVPMLSDGTNVIQLKLKIVKPNAEPNDYVMVCCDLTTPTGRNLADAIIDAIHKIQSAAVDKL